MGDGGRPENTPIYVQGVSDGHLTNTMTFVLFDIKKKKCFVLF